MMCSYGPWYGGLGGYAKAESDEPKRQSATVLKLVRRPFVPKGWADWYQAAADGAW